VYPQGVQAAHISQQVQGKAVMVDLLGLSDGAVVLMLEAPGVEMGKTSVFRSVQATAEQVPGLKRVENDRDSSLTEIQIEPTQALADLKRLGELIHSRQPEESTEVQALYERYAQGASPKKGKNASSAYRMRAVKRERSVLNVSRLIAYCGNHLASGLDLASIVA
jgi:hypothetical protein